MQNFHTMKCRIINHLPNNRKKNQIYIWTINTKVVILHRKTCARGVIGSRARLRI